MRRSTFVIALATLSVAVALAALIYKSYSHQTLRTDSSARDDAGHVQGISPKNMTEDETVVAVEPQRSLTGDRDSTVTGPLVDTEDAPPPGIADEEETAKRVREYAMREAPRRYSLIIERLDLTPSERDALLALLIEDWIASTKTRYSSGEAMDEQERSDRIAAIIGDTKLQKLLALERNLGQYAEVLYIQDVLKKHEVPMTAAQRDRMLEILIEIQNQDLAVPGSDAERGSIERLENQLAKIDERERLVFEQAASVLSAEQVGYLFEWYQRDSYRRTDALERQKKARANDSADDLPLYYPVRTDPDIPQ